MSNLGSFIKIKRFSELSKEIVRLKNKLYHQERASRLLREQLKAAHETISRLRKKKTT